MEYPLIARLNELNISMNDIKEELLTIFSEVGQLRNNPRRDLFEPIWILRRLDQLASYFNILFIEGSSPSSGSNWTYLPPCLQTSLCQVSVQYKKVLIYHFLNFMVSIEDLKHIKIAIQSKGYEEFNGRSNILLNVGFLGKLTDNSTTKYKLNTNGVIETMNSIGIEMIKPMEIDPQLLSGLEWNLKNILNNNHSLIPEEGSLYKDIEGNYSLRFKNYKNRNMNIDEETSRQKENIEDE